MDVCNIYKRFPGPQQYDGHERSDGLSVPAQAGVQRGQQRPPITTVPVPAL